MDEDFFGEDDFDDLPANTFDELEHQARTSTQHKQQQQQGTQRQNAFIRAPQRIANGRTATLNHAASDYGFDNGDDVIDLDAQPTYPGENSKHFPRRPPTDEVTQREQWRLQRYGQPSRPSQNRHDQPRNDASQNTIQKQADTAKDVSILDSQKGAQDSMDISSLRARVVELERQKNDLAKAAEEARIASVSKAGEVLIVRSNQKKDAEEFQKKMKIMQQSHADEMAKSRSELEATRKEREKYETNNRFLEHDLARETAKSRIARQTIKDGSASTVRRAQQSPLMTPKKNRNLPLRDGFDDGEMFVVSPSKNRDKDRAPMTPKAGSKRKRSQQEEAAGANSPALSFTGVEVQEQAESANTTPSALTIQQSDRQKPGSSAALDFIRLVLGHQIDDRNRTLERLITFHLPSNPESNFASAINDKLLETVSDEETDQLRFGVCMIIIDQWSQCLAEKYYEPLNDLTALLHFILAISPPLCATSLISRIVPLCQLSIDLVASPICWVNRDPIAHKLPTRSFKQKVRPQDFLKLLQLLVEQALPRSLKASHLPLDLNNFWTHMDCSGTLQMLHRVQPISQIKQMLSLLHSSILPSSIGPIFHDPAEQKGHESNLIERLGNLLLEMPTQLKPPKRPSHFSDFLRKKSQEELDEEAERNIPPYEVCDVLELRSAVLDLLFQISLSDYGGRQVATHKTLIARLVRFLHESVPKMYATYEGEEYNDETTSDDDDEDEREDSSDENVNESDTNNEIESSRHPKRPSLHTLHTYHINTSVTILYHLSSTYGGLSSSPTNPANDETQKEMPIFNLRSYFESHPSAPQRFLVALSRIAFREQIGCESGIEEDVAAMAHDLLDETVSSEEGEGVLSVFGIVSRGAE